MQFLINFYSFWLCIVTQQESYDWINVKWEIILIQFIIYDDENFGEKRPSFNYLTKKEGKSHGTFISFGYTLLHPGTLFISKHILCCIKNKTFFLMKWIYLELRSINWFFCFALLKFFWFVFILIIKIRAKISQKKKESKFLKH